MRKLVVVFCLVLLFRAGLLPAQGIVWTEITGQFTLPAGVKVFKGERAAPLLKLWYLDVDMNQPDIAIRPYLGPPKGLTAFTQSTGAYAAINGGFFGGSTSVSSVVYPGQVLAQNIQLLNRDGINYHVTRSFFGVDRDRNMAVDWIYHFGGEVGDIYRFAEPVQNSIGTPGPAPDSAAGERYADVIAGIGGGPNLVSGGIPDVTYIEEVFFGSGVGYDNPDPRTALGYTADHHAILLVADGRDAGWSLGVGMPELASILIDLGCVEAMNLDGGGSTQMAIGNVLVNRPEGGTFQRPVPSIWAVVHADSLPLPQIPTYSGVIDTGDPEAMLVGPGWFPTANPGSYGGTPALLNNRGSGDRYAIFRPQLPAVAEYEVYAWWVSDPNRANDTPIVVRHLDGEDTVRVNQTANGAAWNLVGAYTFSADSSDAVIVSNAATTNFYVVADAVRFVSYDPSIVGLPGETPSSPDQFELLQNYPNPFNPETVISYQLSVVSEIRLVIYDLLGRTVRVLAEGRQNAGRYEMRWDGRDESGAAAASGIYFYRLQAGKMHQQKKMLLLR